MIAKYVFLIIIISFTCFSCKNSNYESKSVDFDNIENISVNDNDTTCLKVIVAAMVSPKETYYLYNELFTYVSEKLALPVKFYQRKTYSETNELLSNNIVDLGFICTGAYLKNKNNCDLLVVPVFNNKPYYQAYIIVNKNLKIKNFNDLKGKSFAFTDPLSNTGKLYPDKRIKQLFNLESDKFFKSITYSGSHDVSIQLVSKGIVDGASIDGLIYEYLLYNSPKVMKNIKVIEKSEFYGSPPVVCSKHISKSLKFKLQNIFLHINSDSLGKKILQKLMIDKFILSDDSIYNSASLYSEH